MVFGFLKEIFKSQEKRSAERREKERRARELRAEMEKKAKILKAKFVIENFFRVSAERIRFLEEENEKLRAKVKAGEKSFAQNEADNLRANDAEIAKWRETVRVMKNYLSIIEPEPIVTDPLDSIEGFVETVSINPEKLLEAFDKLDVRP